MSTLEVILQQLKNDDLQTEPPEFPHFFAFIYYSTAAFQDIFHPHKKMIVIKEFTPWKTRTDPGDYPKANVGDYMIILEKLPNGLAKGYNVKDKTTRVGIFPVKHFCIPAIRGCHAKTEHARYENACLESALTDTAQRTLEEKRQEMLREASSDGYANYQRAYKKLIEKNQDPSKCKNDSNPCFWLSNEVHVRDKLIEIVISFFYTKGRRFLSRTGDDPVMMAYLALYIYTLADNFLEEGGGKSEAFYVINKFLRENDDDTHFHRFLLHLEILSEVSDDILVFRGANFTSREDIIEGNSYTEKAIKSATHNIDVAAGFSAQYGTGGEMSPESIGCQLKLININGVKHIPYETVISWSAIPNEKETIILPGHTVNVKLCIKQEKKCGFSISTCDKVSTTLKSIHDGILNESIVTRCLEHIPSTLREKYRTLFTFITDIDKLITIFNGIHTYYSIFATDKDFYIVYEEMRPIVHEGGGHHNRHYKKRNPYKKKRKIKRKTKRKTKNKKRSITRRKKKTRKNKKRINY